MKTDIIYKVRETVCFPNKYKVYPTRLGSKPVRESNGVIYFHPTIESAQLMADNFNKINL